MEKRRTVDEYIAAAPKEVRGRLRELRGIIKSAAPDAEERISYGMPYYACKGRVAYFRHWKNHLGLYIPTPVVEEHKNELKKYHAAGATVRFPLDRKLPAALMRKLIKARIRKNESREQR
jgi:uncharacterized protein YdhG (YjbR/CyaY superfamily)